MDDLSKSMREEISKALDWVSKEVREEIITEALKTKGLSPDLPGYPKVVDLRARTGYVIIETRNHSIIAVGLEALPKHLKEVIQNGINRKIDNPTETDEEVGGK